MPKLSLTKRMIEATMSRDEAIAYAQKWREVKSGRSFTRRFRLEGSRAGNSHLVTKQKAYDLRAEWGGEVVELIPQVKRPTLKEVAASLPTCPICKAEQGKECRSSFGARRKAHRIRLKLQEALSANDWPRCKFCGDLVLVKKNHGIGGCYQPEDLDV